MTNRVLAVRNLSSMLRATTTSFATLVLVAGCAASVSSTPRGPDGTDDPPVTPPPRGCSTAPELAEAVLTTHCTRCHGDSGMAPGGIANMLDVSALRRSGHIVPGAPEESPVYRRMMGGTMPPAAVTVRPGTDDIEAVENWIACGAEPFDTDPTDPTRPPTAPDFVSIDSMLGTMEADLRRFVSDGDRRRQRYIVFTNRVNAADGSDLVRATEAVAYLVNSLSQGSFVVPPTQVDDDGLIWRIDLDDYLWDETTWQTIVQDYPFAVQYDEDSLEFPFDQRAEEFLQEETGAAIPFIYGDWMSFTASGGNRYYDILGLPNTLQELHTQVGLDFEGNLRDLNFIRAGFQDSGVSVSNRVIQRDAIPGGGAFWTSFDFATSNGERNIFENPTDFQFDGGEFIFTLPNGMQAYYIAEADGDRLERAPQAIVSDPRQPDRAVLAGMSCMGCHDATGIIAMPDEIREHVLGTTAGGSVRDEVLRTYPTQEELMRIYVRDGELFRRARAATGIRESSSQATMEEGLLYDESATVNRLAGALGIDLERVRDGVRADTGAFAGSIVALVDRAGARVDREELEAQFPEVVCALGIGQPICTAATRGASCGCADIFDNDGL